MRIIKSYGAIIRKKCKHCNQYEDLITCNCKYLVIKPRNSMALRIVMESKCLFTEDQLLKLIGNMHYEEIYTLLNYDKKTIITLYGTMKKYKEFINYDILIKVLKNNKIPKSKNIYDYDIPRGRKNKNESEIDAIKRELNEEIGIKSDDFIISKEFLELIQKPFPMDNQNNIKYVYKYYISDLVTSENININFNNRKQCEEVYRIKWISKEKLIEILKHKTYYL